MVHAGVPVLSLLPLEFELLLAGFGGLVVSLVSAVDDT
jgi:hypothetical protein